MNEEEIRFLDSRNGGSLWNWQPGLYSRQTGSLRWFRCCPNQSGIRSVTTVPTAATSCNRPSPGAVIHPAVRLVPLQILEVRGDCGGCGCEHGKVKTRSEETRHPGLIGKDARGPSDQSLATA